MLHFKRNFFFFFSSYHRCFQTLCTTAGRENAAANRQMVGNHTTDGSSTNGDREVVRWNRSMTTHMRHGRCDSARRVFDQMPRRTSVSWNIIISGYLSNDRFDLALALFRRMPTSYRDLVSYNIMLTGYVRNHDLASAIRLFESMPDRDVVSWNAMISAYAQNGLVKEAHDTFDRTPHKNEISWNGLLAAYLQNGQFEHARSLFESKPDWDLVSWNAMISWYMRRRQLNDARELFDRMPDRDIVSWNIIISGYAQNGMLQEARRLFEIAPCKDVFTWTSMVSAYNQNNMLEEARGLFDVMPQRNIVSWNAMISGYVQHRKLNDAKILFDAMPCRNISSWNTMLTGYAQAGEIDNAREIFDQMPHRDSISWSAMIAGYSQGGLSEKALGMFIEMKRHRIKINRSSFTCVFSTCADIAMLDCGRQVHGALVKTGYEAGCFVGNALLVMYCKCGCIDDAYDAFKGILDKDIVTWNTMIFGYARHGFGKEALKVFESMRQAEIKPDDITLVAVLSACSHSGLIDRGMNCFYSMHQNYQITPKAQHYTCMIDLLGRAGKLGDAENLIQTAPFEPDSAMWGALLGACRKYGNTKVGETAAKRIFEMEPDNAGMYILLSNLYAASGKWTNADELRILMRERGVRKVPGFSWIEVKNKVHTFSAGDSIHPDIRMIYEFLEEMDMRLKKAGFVSSPKLVLHDVEEEEKENMLKYHSEKLAVAYGILNIPPGRPIRVIKNLRVCEDCHSAIKHISAIEHRLVILRDSNRFHHFSGGACSCGDYW